MRWQNAFWTESELVQLLEASTTVECPDVDVKVFDAATVVNMLPPGMSKTFKDYATSVCLNDVIKQAQNIKKIDLTDGNNTWKTA